MFDIGFWEIMLISIIGLVVLGPQRLPVAIKSVLRWVNTAKTMANSVKNEISQELELQEMNENMIKATKQGLDNIDPNLKASIDKMKTNVEDLTQPYQAATSSQPSTASKGGSDAEIPSADSNKATTVPNNQAMPEGTSSHHATEQEK